MNNKSSTERKKVTYFLTITSILLMLGIAPTLALAEDLLANKTAIEYFASNNSNEIDLQTAFNRLQGDEQQELQNETITIMQKEHLEQSRFENLLGTYKMSSDQNTTADNTEKLMTSSYQKLSSEKIFKIAKELANILKQESVAVFIPGNEPVIGEIVLKLTSHPYSINETIKIIREKLPAQYNTAFSLHLNGSNNICYSFDSAIVTEVEWLGSQIALKEIKKLFPQEEVTTQYGKAYLVYKNGQRETL